MTIFKLGGWGLFLCHAILDVSNLMYLYAFSVAFSTFFDNFGILWVLVALHANGKTHLGQLQIVHFSQVYSMKLLLFCSLWITSLILKYCSNFDNFSVVQKLLFYVENTECKGAPECKLGFLSLFTGEPYYDSCQ